MYVAIRKKRDHRPYKKNYISDICFFTYDYYCMYMVFLIENHTSKNENFGQKKEQAFF